MKILAVDDDESILSILQILVTRAGYDDFVTARSGGEALELIAKARRPFEFFLLDIDMPGMDGIEFCDLLRRLPSYADCPIVMLTAMTERKYIDQAYAAGATDYVIKPFDVNDLTQILLGAAQRLKQVER